MPEPSPASSARADDRAALASSGVLDPVSRDWIERLTASGPELDAALGELHGLLMRAARYALLRRGSRLGQECVDDLAVEAADDAVIAILAHLPEYRGESMFSTWAWKFGFYEACVSIRRRRWLGREIPIEDTGWDALAHKSGPHGQFEDSELIRALRRAVENQLTPHQRRVFVALALNEVPVDVAAERWATTRGALYKTLHEARGRLRRALAADGFGPEICSPTTHRSTTTSRFETSD